MKPIRWVLVALVLLAAACTIESGNPPRADFNQLMADGQQALAEGDGLAARNSFARALEVRPHDSAASLGLVLADVLQLFHFVDEIVSFVISLTNSVTQAYIDDPGGLDPNGDLNDTIHHFVKQIFEPLLDEMLAALDDVLADPQAELQLAALPIVFQRQTLIDLGGTWDTTDAVWLDGTLRLAQGAVDLMQGTNLDMNLGIVFESPVVKKMLNGGQLNLLQSLPQLAEVLAELLGDPEHPDLLQPLPEEKWRFQRAQRNFALAAYYWIDVWGRIDAETGDPSDEILGYIDRNGNGWRDPNEPYAWLGETAFPSLLMDLMPFLITFGSNLEGALAERTDLDQTSATIETLDLSLLNMLLELAGLPNLIPHTYYNLADLFADPPAEEVKDFLVETMTCVSHEQGLANAAVCIAGLLF